MNSTAPSAFRWLRLPIVSSLCVIAPLSVPNRVSAQNTMSVLHSFALSGSPSNPSQGLLRAPDGSFYGTTQGGMGAVFKLTTDGLGNYTRSPLHIFSGLDGTMPAGPLALGADGALYGTTSRGGLVDAGTVYRLETSGQFKVLHSFGVTTGDGSNPFGGVIQASDGWLYGTTVNGGGRGAIFRLDTEGKSFTTLYELQYGQGAYPYAGLVEGSDGFLYGTSFGGDYGGDYGSLFKLRKDGSGFVVLHSFNWSTDGQQPQSALVDGGDGFFYGTTVAGGSGYNGTVFRIGTTPGSFMVIHAFAGLTEGWSAGPLAALQDGWFYGYTGGGGSGNGTAFRVRRDAPALDSYTYETIRTFSAADGRPSAGLVDTLSGKVLGATWGGTLYPLGIIYEMDGSGGNFRWVSTFGGDAPEGLVPNGRLILAPDGNYYGTTLGGGARGAGTVFRMSPDGQDFRTLHDFDSYTEGGGPEDPLVWGGDGYLYGATSFGGTTNYGTAFRVAIDGSSFAVLHEFTAWTDGSHPSGGLADGGDGFLYGTTRQDGLSSGGTFYRLGRTGSPFDVLAALPSWTEPWAPLTPVGSGPLSFLTTTRGGGANHTGSVVRLDTNGNVTTLHEFTGSDGGYPQAGLAAGPGGRYFGTTQSTIYQIDAVDGTSFSLLHTFNSSEGSGGNDLIAGSGDSLYGITSDGGDWGAGTVFSIAPDGSAFTRLYSFDSRDMRGNGPSGRLVQRPDGTLVGTTQLTGNSLGGAVYSISPPVRVTPSTATVCASSSGATLTATTPGNPVLSYQWGYSDLNNQITFLPGQTAPTYVVNTADLPSGTFYAELVCVVRFGGGLGQSTSNRVVVTVDASCSGGAPPSAGILTATTRYGASAVRLQWLNPASTVDEFVVRSRSDGSFPTGPTDGRAVCGGLMAPACGTPTAGGTTTFDDIGMPRGTTVRYALYTRLGGAYSGVRLAAALPFGSPGQLVWSYSTGATTVTPPGYLPPWGPVRAAVYAVSNDRGLHAMNPGPYGGDWPAGWTPLLMNAPSQSRPIPALFPSYQIAGSSHVVFVTSQDGRVYVADALTGALLRSSAVLGDALQASPSGMFRDYGGAWDLLFIGTRSTSNWYTNGIVALDPASLATVWSFDNGGGTNRIGIVSGEPLVDYATNRVYFASRQAAGGTGATVWCLSFTDTSATKVWSANVGSVDAALSMDNGVIYAGNIAGEVWALDAATGAFRWSAPFATNDGPVKGVVWPDGGRLYFATTTKEWAVADNGPGTVPTRFWTNVLPWGGTPTYPIVADGRAYLGNGSGALLQVDANVPTPGTPLGVPLGDPLLPAQVGGITMNSFDNLLYTGTDAGVVYGVAFPF